MRVGSVKRRGFATRTAGGFSLMELLVVMALIAVIAAIAFPVLTKAKQSAQVSECLSNMRQLGMAFEMYLSDHGRRFPAAADWGIPSYQTDGEKTIQELLSPYVHNGMVAEETEPGKFTYPQRTVFACPSDTGLPPDCEGYGGGVKAGVAVWLQTGCSYEYYAANQKNYLNSSTDPSQVPRTALSPKVEINSQVVRIGAPYDNVLYPTKKALLGDIWFWHLGDRVMPDDTVAYSNTLFVDGHAARVRGIYHVEARLQQLARWNSFTELD